MRTVAQKPKASQQTMFAKSKTPGRAHLGQSGAVNSILHLQRTIGNQAVQRLLQTHTETPDVGVAAEASPRFGHDFSRIPIHPPAKGAIQAELGISKPGDEYEQEADHISEQLMRMPEPQLQSACPCGGCPKCQAEQLSREHERLQTRRVGASNLEQTPVPPIVHEVLRSPGQPLDPATRAFMEPRFGHDFGGVRVHADGAASSAARAIRASAFTFGRKIVFGSGEYAPETAEGKQLLAHELTHVVQQGASLPMAAGASTVLSSAGQLLQRAPDKKSDTGIGVPEDLLLHSTAVWPKGLSYEQRIALLAANPDHAQGVWKELSQGDQFAVIINMARFYGEPFSRQFLDHRKSGKKLALGYTFVGPETKSADLVARGYRMAGIQHQMDVEIWFHPSGTRLHRGIAAAKPKEVKREEPPPKEEESEEAPPEEIIEVEDVDPSDLQEQVLALLDELRKLNREMEEQLKAEPVDMQEFIDKESDFSDLRGEIHDLIVQDPTILEDVTGASIRDERKALVDWFLKLREKAYGTAIPDFNKPSSE